MSNKKLSAAERFAKLGERLRKDGRLQIDEAKLELSEQIFQMMEYKDVSEAELARRLNTSRSYVNKVLKGDTNFTIETLVKLGLALDYKFEFQFVANNQEKDIFADDVIYVDVEAAKQPEYITPYSYNYDPITNIFDLNKFDVKKNNDIAISSAANQELALTS